MINVRPDVAVPPTPFGRPIALLGRGALAEVYLVGSDGPQPHTAVKVVRKSVAVLLQAVPSVTQERLALLAAKACSPNVVTILDTAQDSEFIYLRMEAVLVTATTALHLRSLLTSSAPAGLPPADVAWLCACLARALAHLHSRRIVHRDLKPENVALAADGSPTLVDFGSAKQLPASEESSHTYCGTGAYMAPEQLARRGHGIAVDCWALGVVLFEMLRGHTPLVSATAADLRQASCVMAKHRAALADAAPAAPELLDGLLAVEPTARLSASAATEHCWLRSVTEPPTELGRLVAQAAHEAATGVEGHGEEEDEDEAAEAAEVRAWAQAEREEMLEKADAMWRRERERWQPLFDAFGPLPSC